MQSAEKPARRAPASQCRRPAPKTTVRSAAATAAPISTSAWPTHMGCRLANRASVRAWGRPGFRPVRSAAVAPAARRSPVGQVCSVDTPKCSTAAKSPVPASVRNSPPCAPRNGRRSAAVTGATTATTAWRTRTAFPFGIAAYVKTRHRQPRGRLVPAAGSQALPNAARASFANSRQPRNVARRTVRGSANPARRPARLTTTLSAAATARPTQTHVPLMRLAYRSRERAAVRRPDRGDSAPPFFLLFSRPTPNRSTVGCQETACVR